MRKKPRHRNAPVQLPRKRVLQLSQETIRTLTSDELALAAAGSACPTTSWPTTDQANSGDTCTV